MIAVNIALKDRKKEKCECYARHHHTGRRDDWCAARMPTSFEKEELGLWWSCYALRNLVSLS